MTTVILADVHTLFREALCHLFAGEPAIKVVAHAADGLEAVRLVQKHRPSVLLLELMLPRLHGLEVIRQVRRACETKVVVVSSYSDEPYVVESFRNGAMGYVLKSASASEIKQSIQCVEAGAHYVCTELSDMALNVCLKRSQGDPPDSFQMLTAREREVLQLAAEGRSTADIGRALFISPRTVETHRANIMKKLALRTQTDLVRFAIRRKIIAA